jgi:hypothetical protein
MGALCGVVGPSATSITAIATTAIATTSAIASLFRPIAGRAIAIPLQVAPACRASWLAWWVQAWCAPR